MIEDEPQVDLFDVGPETSPPEAQFYPGWYTPSKERARANRSVLNGRHPLGRALLPGAESCGTCALLVRKSMGTEYLKCSASKMSNGPATDVRKKWQACEAWEEKPCQKHR